MIGFISDSIIIDIVKSELSSVVDTVKDGFTGVVGTGEDFFSSVVDTSVSTLKLKKYHLPVSLMPARKSSRCQ